MKLEAHSEPSFFSSSLDSSEEADPWGLKSSDGEPLVKSVDKDQGVELNLCCNQCLAIAESSISLKKPDTLFQM